MFNKICFYIFVFLSIITLSLNFLRVILDIDVLKCFLITNNILIYLRNLSNPAKIVTTLIVSITIIVLLKGFIGYINSLKSKWYKNGIQNLILSLYKKQLILTAF